MKILDEERVKELIALGELEPDEEEGPGVPEILSAIEKHLGRLAANARGGRLEDGLLDLTRAVEKLNKERPEPKRAKLWRFTVKRDKAGRVSTVDALGDERITWKFSIERDSMGLIKTITAEA